MLPLIFTESVSEGAADLVCGNGGMAVWWGTYAGCAVAIGRQNRGRGFDDQTEQAARAGLAQPAENCYKVEPMDELRLLPMIVSKDYEVKAADPLQLVSVLRWCEVDGTGVGFVSLDDQLRRAAQDEGLGVLPDPSKTR